METNTEKEFSQVNEKKREWIKGLLKMSEDEKAQEAFRKFQEEFNGKLYQYSFSNFLWLAIQTYERGSFAFSFNSFNNWKKVKRHVKKGEHGMAVLVPMTIARKDENGKPIFDEKGQPKTFTYYTVKNGVFSIDQTEGEDGETFASFRTVVDFHDFMFDDLFDKVKVKHEIEFQTLSTSCGGFTDGNKIVLNSERDKPSQFVTLVHELSHCTLEHSTEQGRELAGEHIETEAELSTLIYCTLAGIEAKGSAFYLKKVDFDTLDIKHINRAIKAASKMYEEVHGKKEYKKVVA